METSSSTRRKEFAGGYGSAAWGDYQLARQPDGAGPFVVDARTGAVSLRK